MSQSGRPLSGFVRPGTQSAHPGTMDKAIRTPRTAQTARPVSSASGRFVRLGTVSVNFSWVWYMLQKWLMRYSSILNIECSSLNIIVICCIQDFHSCRKVRFCVRYKFLCLIAVRIHCIQKWYHDNSSTDISSTDISSTDTFLAEIEAGVMKRILYQ